MMLGRVYVPPPHPLLRTGCACYFAIVLTLSSLSTITKVFKVVLLGYYYVFKTDKITDFANCKIQYSS